MTRLPSIFQAPNRPPRSYEASWGLILFAWPCRFWKCNVFGNRTGRKEDIAKSWEPGKLIFLKQMLASSLRSSTSGLRGRMRPVEASFCSLDHAEFRNVTILGIGPPEVKISLKNASSLMMISLQMSCHVNFGQPDPIFSLNQNFTKHPQNSFKSSPPSQTRVGSGSDLSLRSWSWIIIHTPDTPLGPTMPF